MTSFPSFASVNLFWFAVVAASLCLPRRSCAKAGVEALGGEVSLRRHGGTAPWLQHVPRDRTEAIEEPRRGRCTSQY